MPQKDKSNSTILPLDPKSRWGIQKLILGRMMGYEDIAGLEQEVCGQLAGEGIKSNLLDTLVHAEADRARIGPLTEPDAAWPAPLAHTVRELLSEDLTNGIRNALRLVDLFEVLIKYVTSIAVADMVQGRDFSPALRELLAASLHVPSLGHWSGYCRTAIQELGGREQPPFVPELLDYQERHLTNDLDALLALRNAYAHGATPPEEHCLGDCNENMPRLLRLLRGGRFLTRYPLVCVQDDKAFMAMGIALTPFAAELPGTDSSALLHNTSTNSWLNLSPLLAFRACRHKGRDGHACGRRKFLFYNDQKKKHAVTYLDYIFSHHGRDPEMLPRFREVFPLPDWRSRQAKDRSKSIIEEKIEGFLGRAEEMRQIRNWVGIARRGFFMVLGPPGIGKSALVAALTRQEWEHVDVLCHFIRRVDRPTPLDFLRRLLNDVAQSLGAKFIARSLEEMQAELDSQFRLASGRLQENGRKLLVIIDGLDEAIADTMTAAGEQTVLDVLPRHVPENILLLLTGRPRKQVTDLYDELDREGRRKSSLEGLSVKEVRGMLYGPISKYELDANYVAAVSESSGGNPLYVKMIVEEVFEGRLSANDISRLPCSLEEVYEAILKRLHRARDGQGVIDILLTLAYAREQLTVGQVAAINGFDLHRSLEVVDVCLEVLREDVDISGNRTVGIFHDSFAGFLKAHKDLSGEREKTLIKYLRCTICAKRQPEIPESFILALVRNEHIPLTDIPALSGLMECSSALLTSFGIAVDALCAHQLTASMDHLTALARSPGAATAKAATECVTGRLRQNPQDAATLLKALIPGRRKPAPGPEALGNIQVARVCADASLAVITLNAAQDAAIKAFEAMVRHPDANVRTIGVMGVFRVSRQNFDSALEIVQRIANNTISFGFPRPSLIEPLTSCMLGLLSEHIDNPVVRSKLGKIASETISRIILLRPIVWILPRIVSRFLSRVPDDCNPCNLAEFREFKAELKKSPELAKLTNSLTDHCNPLYGSRKTFHDLMESSHQIIEKHRSGVTMYAFIHVPVFNRVLTGDESALDEAYQHWLKSKNLDNFCQDLGFQLRMIQVGKRIRNHPPLNQIWHERAENALRIFYFQKGGKYRNTKNYIGGTIITTLPFLASQKGDGHLSIFTEMIEHATSIKNKYQEKFNGDELCTILLRVIEINAIEYGTYDPSGRAVAFHGLHCFLKYPDLLNESSWDDVVRILSKMQLFYYDEVNDFLNTLPDFIEQNIRRRIIKVTPEISLGELLSYRLEKFWATLYSEPIDAEKPLRPYMMDIMYALCRPESLHTTLRHLIRTVFKILGR